MNPIKINSAFCCSAANKVVGIIFESDRLFCQKVSTHYPKKKKVPNAGYGIVRACNHISKTQKQNHLKVSFLFTSILHYTRYNFNQIDSKILTFFLFYFNKFIFYMHYIQLSIFFFILFIYYSFSLQNKSTQ